MQTLRWLPALLLLALLSACASPQKDDFDYTTCGVRPRVALPVQMRNGIPLVQATIKGAPATFVLDTGSVGIVLTNKALTRLELSTNAHQTVSGMGVGGTSTSFVGNLKELKIGGLPVPDHQIQVLPDTSAISASGVVDGLFGADVLSVFEIDLDLPQNQVTLYAGRLCPDTRIPPPIPAWNTAYSTIDASRSTNHRFMIQIALNGKPITALLDTGAARSLVAKDVALSLGITEAALQAGPHVTMVGTGPNRPVGYIYRFRDITLGDQTYNAPVLVVADRAEPDTDMILGEDFLATHRLWLSYARKQVYVQKIPPGSVPLTQ